MLSAVSWTVFIGFRDQRGKGVYARVIKEGLWVRLSRAFILKENILGRSRGQGTRQPGCRTAGVRLMWELGRRLPSRAHAH